MLQKAQSIRNYEKGLTSLQRQLDGASGPGDIKDILRNPGYARSKRLEKVQNLLADKYSNSDTNQRADIIGLLDVYKNSFIDKTRKSGKIRISRKIADASEVMNNVYRTAQDYSTKPNLPNYNPTKTAETLEETLGQNNAGPIVIVNPANIPLISGHQEDPQTPNYIISPEVLDRFYPSRTKQEKPTTFLRRAAGFAKSQIIWPLITMVAGIVIGGGAVYIASSSKIDDLDSRLKDTTKQIAEIKTSHETEYKKTVQTIEDYKKTMGNKDQKNTELEGKLSLAKDEVTSMNSRIRSLEDQVKSAESSKKSYEESKESFEQKVIENATKYAELQAQYEVLKQKLEADTLSVSSATGISSKSKQAQESNPASKANYKSKVEVVAENNNSQVDHVKINDPQTELQRSIEDNLKNPYIEFLVDPSSPNYLTTDISTTQVLHSYATGKTESLQTSAQDSGDINEGSLTSRVENGQIAGSNAVVVNPRQQRYLRDKYLEQADRFGKEVVDKHWDDGNVLGYALALPTQGGIIVLDTVEHLVSNPAIAVVGGGLAAVHGGADDVLATGLGTVGAVSETITGNIYSLLTKGKLAQHNTWEKGFNDAHKFSKCIYNSDNNFSKGFDFGDDASRYFWDKWWFGDSDLEATYLFLTGNFGEAFSNIDQVEPDQGYRNLGDALIILNKIVPFVIGNNWNSGGGDHRGPVGGFNRDEVPINGGFTRTPGN